MAITIVATAGSAVANSLVLETEQIAYMAARLNNSAWTTVTGTALTDDENKALVEATRDISALVFLGDRVTGTQALSWPRQNAHDPDSPVADFFATTVIPQRIKDAVSELAFQYLKAGTTDIAALSITDGVKRKRTDVLETEYFEPYTRTTGLRKYPRIWNLVSPLLGNTSSLTRPLTKG